MIKNRLIECSRFFASRMPTRSRVNIKKKLLVPVEN